MKKEDYIRLCQEVWEHNRLYYVENAPVISDYAFDQLLKQLEKIEAEHSDWIIPSSPTQRIGESVVHGFKTVSHTTPMLSLANTYSKEELLAFIKRCHKILETEEVPFAAELKMDGTAISILYEEGKFSRAVTRGDGKQGDDVTSNARVIQNLPLEIQKAGSFEVRGEVYMPHKIFQQLNQAREEAGLEPLANPRNAAAGALKLLNPRASAARGLQIAFYGIDEGSTGELRGQEEALAFLEQLGLPTVAEHTLCLNFEAIWAFCEQVRHQRSLLNYDIDGVVVKVNAFSSWRQMGSTAKSPRWACAYKFAPEQAITKLKSITIQVGRTGVLTPVAELEPTELAGSTISRATLHNAEEIARKDIRPGDTVIIEKGGDVIPKVTSVCLDQRPLGTKIWQMPYQCPSCHTPVEHKEGEVAIRCPNHLCPAQRHRTLLHFVSKGAMNIDHLGTKVIAALLDNDLVKRPSDLYALAAEDFAKLPGFKERAISNALTAIAASRQVPLERFLMALGIPHVGAGTAEALALRFGSIETIMNLEQEEFMNVEGVGEKVAMSLFHYFQTAAHRDEIERLLRVGVHPSVKEVKEIKDHPFSGKIFVLTGTLTQLTREEAICLIKERGGKVSGSVSRNTDYVVAGEAAGSKLDKARQLNIDILSESDFTQLL
ncbi:MAG: NAD-dependent DNA ligase LigA [Verrucomicrobia bacterium]|nr:NAD-dependent DNA ligase LigA [Verrucomicrobiota bacterium]